MTYGYYQFIRKLSSLYIIKWWTVKLSKITNPSSMPIYFCKFVFFSSGVTEQTNYCRANCIIFKTD